MKRSAALPNPLVAVCLAVVLLAGCSSVKTRVDTGVIEARTFAFVARNRPAPAGADDSEAIHAAIQDAITKDLAAKGVRRVSATPDVMVAYLVVISDRATTQAVDAYFGRDRPHADLDGKAHEAYANKKNPNFVQAGTLLIDFLDGRTAALLKRTFVTRPILQNPSPEVRAANIQGAVDEALADLRIEP
jgi:hypothetical protein